MDKILQFSMVGFVTVTEKIEGRNTINIIMHEDIAALNEMVVVGYGARKDIDSKSYSMAAPSSVGYGGRHHSQV